MRHLIAVFIIVAMFAGVSFADEAVTAAESNVSFLWNYQSADFTGIDGFRLYARADGNEYDFENPFAEIDKKNCLTTTDTTNDDADKLVTCRFSTGTDELKKHMFFVVTAFAEDGESELSNEAEYFFIPIPTNLSITITSTVSLDLD